MHLEGNPQAEEERRISFVSMLVMQIDSYFGNSYVETAINNFHIKIWHFNNTDYVTSLLLLSEYGGSVAPILNNNS
jgi:hypothetical protein